MSKTTSQLKTQPHTLYWFKTSKPKFVVFHLYSHPHPSSAYQWSFKWNLLPSTHPNLKGHLNHLRSIQTLQKKSSLHSGTNSSLIRSTTRPLRWKVSLIIHPFPIQFFTIHLKLHHLAFYSILASVNYCMIHPHSKIITRNLIPRWWQVTLGRHPFTWTQTFVFHILYTGTHLQRTLKLGASTWPWSFKWNLHSLNHP